MSDENANPSQPAEGPTAGGQPTSTPSEPAVAATQGSTPPTQAPAAKSPSGGPASRQAKRPMLKGRPKPKPSPLFGQITAEKGHVPLTEEFDRARWTLPPVGVVLIALGIVAVVVAAMAFLGRAKPVASGSVNDVGVAQVSDNSVLAVIQFTMYNTTEKPLWIKEMGAKIKTDQGEFSDTAASAADFERYFQGFPDLRTHASNPMLVETKIAPGGRQNGTIIVSFPINKDAFEKRQSLSVVVTPYDQRDVVLTKTGATP
jgi:hypothetical protein